MSDRPKKAMIMAAGLGQRMRPLTNDRPKPLVQVAGRPLIDHVLERLEGAGVEEAVVNLHYRGDMLRSHLKNRKAPKILFSDETEALLDTGGGLKKARPLLGEGPVVTHNSDSIWAEGRASNLERLAASWNDTEMDALLLLAPVVQCIGYSGKGDFTMDSSGRLTRREKARVAPFVWTGVQILHTRLLDDAPDGAFSTNILLDKALKAGRLFGMRLDGLWMHVGSPDAIAEAEKALGAA
jgi:MurNAc alpha-1-phosphate uridylyltransferase